MVRMLRRFLAVGMALAAVAACGTSGRKSSGGSVGGPSVLQFHNHATRDGVFVDPLMTAANAAKMKLDPTFGTGTIDGSVYGQPLYVEGSPVGDVFIVATEKNNVYAVDA